MKRINLVSDTINKSDVSRLIEWLGTDEVPRLTKGPVTIELEEKWSKWLGVKRTIYVNSGSSAILLALASMKEAGMLKNDKIVVPTLSWLTDVSSPIQLGLKPILCDCNLNDLSLDLDNLEEIFVNERPAAVILVSVLGLIPDMNRLTRLCKMYDVKLIEDVCESMGSRYDDEKLGTFGDVSVFSLYYGHHISTIEGGFISTNNDNLADIIVSMRSHGWDRDWSSEKQKEFRKTHNISEFDALYTFYYPGYNLRSTDLQAYIGLTQIDKLNSFVFNRQRNFLQYEQELRSINGLKLTVLENDTISNFAYPFLAKSKEHRKRIVDALIENQIEVRPLIAGSMGRKPFWIAYKGHIQEFQNADKVNDLGFYIPNHQDLNEEDIKRISKIIKSIK